MIGRFLKTMALGAGLAIAFSQSPAHADKLDDVIDNGELRCGVVLDFPPIGYRDANNEPAGYDVDMCKDLAKVLGVDLKLLPVTWSERLPLIVTNRADVVIGSTSDALERAKTVGFSIPYVIFFAQAIVNKDAGVKTFDDLAGKRVAAGLGTVEEAAYLEIAKKRGWEKDYQAYQSQNEVVLAVAQGKADVGITTNTAVRPIVQQYDTIEAGPRMPWTPDYASFAGPRKDVSWLNYLNLFITHQVRSGRYAELWETYVGGEAPELRIPGVMY